MRKALFFLVSLFLVTNLVACSKTALEAEVMTTMENENNPAIIPENAVTTIQFGVDASVLGKEITNKVSNINMWNYRSDWLGTAEMHEEDYFSQTMPFVQYVQFMQATGGSEDRDLFKNPSDSSVLDDYDFSSLIRACHNVVKQGLKPHIKTGNIPLKYSTNPVKGTFGVNLYPPDDYNQYYAYITALANALVQEFGKEEVLKWRWGVYTEYENGDWFKVDGTNPKDSFQAYCKIYDYTVSALQDAIDETVIVGAHSMTVSEGLWDERDFITHCATGTNYKTGKIGTRLNYLSVSFYDRKPGKYSERNLIETIAVVREQAEKVGFTELEYGVDEGRLLVGIDDRDLTSRVVGQSYQGAYDARLIKQMVENDIAYFSAWSYTSNGIWKGLPTVSLHVANRFYEMVGSKMIAVTKSGETDKKVEVDAIAGYNEEKETLFVMAYNFKNNIVYRDSVGIGFQIHAPMLEGKVKVTRYVVDDTSNFFDDWVKDQIPLEIYDRDFDWSSDSSYIETPTTLKKEESRNKFYQQYPNYTEKSRLIPTSGEAVVKDGILSLYVDAPPQAVVFYKIEPVKN